MPKSLTNREKYQEKAFDEKAGKKKMYAIGGRDNRNHSIKIQKITEALQLKDHDKILEIGVGEGEHAYKCLRYADIEFVGIDISEKTLEVADKRLEPKFQGRYKLRQDNANNLSFTDNTFDAVFCAATLHHMEKPFRMISEMVRVLKPGGRLAMMEPNWIYPTNIGFMILLKEDRNMWLMKRNNFMDWLKQAGMHDINVEHLIYTPPAPKFMVSIYDIIDKTCANLPLLKRCSLMLFGSGVK